MNRFLSFCVVILGAMMGSSSGRAQEHPFLIVTEDMYPALREKAQHPKFQKWVERAGEKWDDDIRFGNWDNMSALLNNNMLLYILHDDADRREQYRKQILSVIDQWDALIPEMGTDHANTVYASSALFNSILALDVICGDLTDEVRHQAEKKIETVHQWFLANRMQSGREIAWRLCRQGVVTLYYMYMQDEANVREWVESYRHHLLDLSMMIDGSWSQSVGYAHARIAGTRTAKSNIIDVIQFNGLYDFYADPQMIKLMDWLNAFSLTPFGTYTRFGETGLTKKRLDGCALLYFMKHYGERAAQNAAWHYGPRETPRTSLTNAFVNFVLIPIENPEPEIPESLLMPSSGAALWGRSHEHDALSGVLYSLKRENWEPGSFHHASEDVNSIGIHGYGAYLIANAGTNYKPKYPGKTPDGGRWFEAWMQNVVLIGSEKRHASKEGGGLIGGMTGGMVEYGTTQSGEALGNGVHERTLMLIHDVPGMSNGYFAMIDEVVAAEPDQMVRILLQPNTKDDGLTMVAEGQEYLALANGFTSDATDGDERITVFYGTRPASVSIVETWKGSFDQGNFKNKCLEAEYETDTENHSRSVTILFPQDSKHEKGALTRIAGEGYTGARIQHAEAFSDWIVESDGVFPCEFDRCRFVGKTVFFRTGQSQNAYVLINGTRFYDAQGEIGVETDEPVSIQVEDGRGTVMSSGASIKFYRPGVVGVAIDDESIPIEELGEGWVRAFISEGQHALTLTLGDD